MPSDTKGDRPFLDPRALHPVSLPGGGLHPDVVHLSEAIDHPNITVGPHAYASDFEPVEDWAARLAPYLFPGAPERLEIGAFAQIAHGARFVTSSANHPMRGFSTYPFLIFRPETMMDYAGEAATHGDTVIGPDVWIGHGAMILPGVTLGAGVIVGAGSVVARDAPPYAIVAGAPAEVKRMRFPPDVIAMLLEIAWWTRGVDWIERHHAAIAGGDIAALRRAAEED